MGRGKHDDASGFDLRSQAALIGVEPLGVPLPRGPQLPVEPAALRFGVAIQTAMGAADTNVIGMIAPFAGARLIPFGGKGVGFEVHSLIAAEVAGRESGRAAVVGTMRAIHMRCWFRRHHGNAVRIPHRQIRFALKQLR